ncbi:MAG: FkbM family methyltransferase [Desulfovibrio sp.]|nr:FkbM family methyltransferase [Desulfovibrio sp.]
MGTRFVYNPGSPEGADALVVFDEPHQTLASRIPAERRLLFIGEPPGIKSYRPAFLNQFGTVVCPYVLPGYQGRQLVSQSALPWHFGINRDSANNAQALSWQELEAMPLPRKPRKLSVLCSNKAFSDGHKRRLAFLERVKKRFPDSVDIFGRGFTPVADKAEALVPYRYHLVLENNDQLGFWTEKLADAFLGFCFPLFCGCADIHRYFAGGSLRCLDMDSPQQALEQIAAILEQDPYEEHLGAVIQARTQVLNEYNMFSIAASWYAALPASQALPVAERIETNTQQGKVAMDRTGARSFFLRTLDHTKKHVPTGLKQRLKTLYRAVHDFYALRVSARNPFLFVDANDTLGKRKKAEGYYSQRGQDYFVYERIFKKKPNGFFLDVGANHPTKLSNTYFLEQHGWTGLAFEPQEHVRALWADCRKTPCLPYVVGAFNGTVEFSEVQTDAWQHALAGVSSHMETQVPNLNDVPIKKVFHEQRSLQSIIEEYNLHSIDLLSVDVEGYEQEVLNGLDLEKTEIKCIILENDRSFLGDTALRECMLDRGYKQVARLSGDDVFVRRHSVGM